jgi:hypothetical protein
LANKLTKPTIITQTQKECRREIGGVLGLARTRNRRQRITSNMKEDSKGELDYRRETKAMVLLN